MLDARNPDLLAIDDVAVALLDRCRLDARRVRAGRRLRHAHGLQADFTAGDARQVFLALRFRAVPDQRVHIVHLAVTGAGIAARTVDLLHDDRGLGQAEARTAVGLRDQRRHPAGLGQRVHKFFRITARLIDLAVILGWEFGAERANGVADFGIIVRDAHDLLPPSV